MQSARGITRRAFTLIELLVTLAIIAALIGILLPSLTAARNNGRSAVCLSNLRQLGAAFSMYAADSKDRCMPLAYWSTEIIGDGPPVFWWGTDTSGEVDHTAGFVWPYLQSRLAERSVFECPMQPWNSYRAQGAARAVTSTYGYNGYYLSPSHTPGWAFQIGHRPWRNLSHIGDTARVFSFGDTLIDLGGRQPRNTALLDPPMLFASDQWSPNANPTTSFRHARAANLMHVDGHASSYQAERNWIRSTNHGIGSVGEENDPHYVPDWREWRAP